MSCLIKQKGRKDGSFARRCMKIGSSDKGHLYDMSSTTKDRDQCEDTSQIMEMTKLFLTLSALTSTIMRVTSQTIRGTQSQTRIESSLTQ